MRIIFIRHGDPDYAKDSLTEKGWHEAELLSERVKRWQVTKFYSSPLGRAQATAKPTMEKTGRTYEILDWTKEFHIPIIDATGKQRIPWDFMPAWWTQQPEFFERDKWLDQPVMQSGAVRENYETVCRKLDELLSSYGYVREGSAYRVERHTDDTIVLFCHYGITMIMLSHMLNISPVLLLHGMFCAPTSVTIACAEEREGNTAYFRCQTVGDTSHLYGDTISGSGYFAPAWQG